MALLPAAPKLGEIWALNNPDEDAAQQAVIAKSRKKARQKLLRGEPVTVAELTGPPSTLAELNRASGFFRSTRER